MKALYLALGRDLLSADAGTTHTTSIVTALASLGHEVTLVARGADASLVAPAACVPDAPVKPTGPTAWRKAARDLASSAGGVDVIQERAEESGGVGVALSAITAKPLVLEVNTPVSGHPNPVIRRLADWNLRRQARRAAAIITQTPLSRSIIETYTDSPVYVVPNGADPERFSPTVPPAMIAEASGRKIVAFAGSLRTWHGVEDLIEAAGMVIARRDDVFFLFIGSGPLEERARASASRMLGQGDYLFTGAVEPSEVPAFLAAAAVLAAPFAPAKDGVRKRQFARSGMWWSPVKIFEYMAMGKPIVASAAGMVSEYAAGAALTFPPGNVSALADCICSLLDDEESARLLGKAAREKLVQHYTWRRAAEMTAAVWQQALRRGQKVSRTT
mgnify:CR=1 FL=1